MALVGRIARVHGLRGQVIINPTTDFPESRFSPGSVVFRAAPGGGPQPLRVVSVRFHRDRPIVGFEGVQTIELAEPLVGAELKVPVEWLQALPAGTYYQHDLVGCRVETRSGTTVGEVARVEGEAGASRLAIGSGDEELLVPLAADICVSIDVAKKVIVIEPPEGLLDVNRRRAENGETIGSDTTRPRRRRWAGRKPRA